MAALQSVTQSNMSTSGNSYSSSKDGAAATPASENVVSNQFPAGLRVLVVDDDATTLKIIEQMSRRCCYNATTCCEATVALNLLREKKGCFDVVLSDVHMPDMDGYKLLEHVGLEMDLPVIMMSADSRTSAVMKGIRHGACDYLIKPVREEELKNIWQHVVRKKWNDNKEHENSGSLDDNDRNKQGNEEAEYTSSVIDAAEGIVRAHKRRSTSKEGDDGDLENDDPSTTKKARVVWSVELHQQFVSAVNQLGLDKAVPKRILELMNVPGLTRENVASHLQKFRLYLKRITAVAQQQNSNSGPVDASVKLSGGRGRFDIQALAATGQVPPQTLAALHAELYGRPAGNVVPTVDQTAILQASIHGSKNYPAEHGVAYGQVLVKCPSNIAKSFPQGIMTIDDVSPAYGGWPPSNTVGSLGPNSSLEGTDPQNNNMMDMLQHQQQQRQLQLQQQMQQQQLQQQMQQQQLQQQPTIHDQGRSINVQPSCLVVPSQSSASLLAGNSHASVNQNCSIGRNAFINYNLFSPQSNNSSFNVAQFPDGEINARGVLSRYNSPSTISPSGAPGSINIDSSTTQQLQNSTLTLGALRQIPAGVPNISDTQGLYCTGYGDVLDQGALKNLGFVSKGISIPSRFAAHEIESSMDEFSQGNISVDSNGNTVKVEPNIDFMDNSKGGFPPLRRC